MLKKYYIFEIKKPQRLNDTIQAIEKKLTLKKK